MTQAEIQADIDTLLQLNDDLADAEKRLLKQRHKAFEICRPKYKTIAETSENVDCFMADQVCDIAKLKAKIYWLRQTIDLKMASFNK
jgi:hypothetical protein